MTLPLTTAASEAIESPVLEKVTLVVLTTYTDRSASTVNETFYFADRSLVYRYGGGAFVDFEPYLVRLDLTEEAITHIPDLSVPELRVANLTVRNHQDSEGNWLLTRLQDAGIELARVEIAELLLDPSGWGFARARQMAGTEHVVTFRGVVDALSGIGNSEIQIPLIQERLAIEPIVLPAVADADIAERDAGTPVNVVYGAMPRVPLQGVDVGATGRVSAIVADTDTTIEIDDTSRFDPSGGTGRVNNEDIAWTGFTGNTLTGVTRAQGGTTAQFHAVGSTIVQFQSEYVWLATGHKTKAIGDLYARSPITGDVVRVTTSVTKNVNDTGLESPASPWGSVRFTQAQLEAMIDEIQEVQPEFTGASGPSIITQVVATKARVEKGVDHGDPSASLSGTADDWDQGQNTTGTQTGWSLLEGGGSSGTANFFGWLFYISDDSVFADPSAVVSRWRIKASANVFGANTTIPARVVFIAFESGNMGISSIQRVLELTSPAGVDTTGVAGGSAWFTAGSGLTLSNFSIVATGPYSGFRVLVYLTKHGDHPNAGETTKMTMSDGSIELEFELAGGGSVSRTVDVSTAAKMRVGEGLELFADVDGYEATGTDYSVPAGDLLENPPDIFRHLLAERAGLGHGVIDPTTWAEAETNLGHLRMAFLERAVADNFSDLRGRLQFESRSQLVCSERSAGTVWRLLAASPLYFFGGVSGTIDEWVDAESSPREAAETRTRWRALFGERLDIPGGAEDSFTGVLLAEPARNDLDVIVDLASAEARYGRRDHPGVAFLCLQDEASVNDVFGYYVNEGSRNGANLITLAQVPWSDAFAVEIGDIVSVQIDAWDEARACRVLGKSRNWETGFADISLVQVGGSVTPVPAPPNLEWTQVQDVVGSGPGNTPWSQIDWDLGSDIDGALFSFSSGYFASPTTVVKGFSVTVDANVNMTASAEPIALVVVAFFDGAPLYSGTASGSIQSEQPDQWDRAVKGTERGGVDFTGDDYFVSHLVGTGSTNSHFVDTVDFLIDPGSTVTLGDFEIGNPALPASYTSGFHFLVYLADTPAVAGGFHLALLHSIDVDFVI